MYSFGFQQAYQRGFEPGDEIFFTKVNWLCSGTYFPLTIRQCFEAAKAVIKNFIDVLAPSGYMRYSADGLSSSHFVVAVAHWLHLRSLRLLVLCVRFSS